MEEFQNFRIKQRAFHFVQEGFKTLRFILILGGLPELSGRPSASKECEVCWCTACFLRSWWVSPCRWAGGVPVPCGAPHHGQPPAIPSLSPPPCPAPTAPWGAAPPGEPQRPACCPPPSRSPPLIAPQIKWQRCKCRARRGERCCLHNGRHRCLHPVTLLQVINCPVKCFEIHCMKNAV